VCVLGAGVAGLTTAVRIAEEVPGARVQVIAEKWSGDTTTHGAAGLWQPYKVDGAAAAAALCPPPPPSPSAA
jgi:glycine/D-amino acid oxidase-like deaminating enzyme